MKKVVMIKCDEQEILALIQERFHENFDSIVEYEELGNQKWTTSVTPADQDTYKRCEEAVGGRKMYYMTTAFMDVLCAEGKLDAGNYLVDCTW